MLEPIASHTAPLPCLGSPSYPPPATGPRSALAIGVLTVDIYTRRGNKPSIARRGLVSSLLLPAAHPHIAVCTMAQCRTRARYAIVCHLAILVPKASLPIATLSNASGCALRDRYGKRTVIRGPVSSCSLRCTQTDASLADLSVCFWCKSLSSFRRRIRPRLP